MTYLQTTTTRKPLKIKDLSPGKGGDPISDNRLELVEHEEGPGDQTAKGSKVVPMQLVAKIKG
jgi:hypothetical protein